MRALAIVVPPATNLGVGAGLARGRIPKAVWAYVRKLSDLCDRVYQVGSPPTRRSFEGTWAHDGGWFQAATQTLGLSPTWTE